MTFKLSRRAVLRGLGGAVVGLPVLEAMLDANGVALAQTGSAIPKRYVVCSAGTSLGAGSTPITQTYVPNTAGFNYDLKKALLPFAQHDNIKNEISVVTGLKIPWAGENAGVVPAAGRPNNHHETMVSPLLCGVKTPSGDGSVCYGTTSDQLVADAIGGSTVFKSLVYRVQVKHYLEGDGESSRGVISYRLRDGQRMGERASAIYPVVSPKQAYDSLFFNFTPATAAAVEQHEFARATSASVVDLVRGNAERLIQRVGASDRERLQRHLDELRDLERRIAAIPQEQSGACVKPASPGNDPPIGAGRPGDNHTDTTGYSNEDLRARVFCDLIHMAFACDLTRSVAMQFTHFHSWMNMYPLLGVRSDLHEIGHGQGNTPVMADVLAWHYKHFAYLVAKLRDTPEGAGSLLDHAALVMVHEGGYGRDPSDNSDRASHSTENMACLIAGRAGGLRPGQHVLGRSRHPASVLRSAMRAVGVDRALGEVDSVIPELFG